MKIALIGYGNMGQEIEKVVSESKTHQIVSVSYRKPTDPLDLQGIAKSDVAIDFTSPEVILKTIKQIAKMKKNIVVGTTGWYDNLTDVKKLIKKVNTGFIYAHNFSVGVNIYFKIVEYTASLVNKFPQYDIYGFEIHHKGKKDSPSGTAEKISEIIIDNISSKKVLQPEKLDRQITQEELHFASIRGGSNPGFHEVILDSQADEIRLTHSARGRRGFAEGAVIAAEFIQNKKGFYSFEQLFQ